MSNFDHIVHVEMSRRPGGPVVVLNYQYEMTAYEFDKFISHLTSHAKELRKASDQAARKARGGAFD